MVKNSNMRGLYLNAKKKKEKEKFDDFGIFERGKRIKVFVVFYLLMCMCL